MITSETQLKVTLEKIKDLRLSLLQPLPMDLPEVMKKAHKDALKSLIKTLEEEVEAYKKAQNA